MNVDLNVFAPQYCCLAIGWATVEQTRFQPVIDDGLGVYMSQLLVFMCPARLSFDYSLARDL